MAQPIGVILQQWADLGIFFYVLPFLLVFSLVYAVLYKINIMGGDKNSNRGVYAIIAVTVSLLSLQFDSVPIFFQILFPKIGIGLSIILAGLILMGLFAPDATKRSGFGMLMISLGGVIGIIILVQSIDDYSWWTGSFWQQNISAIIVGIIIVSIVIIFMNAGKESDKNEPPGLLKVWKD